MTQPTMEDIATDLAKRLGQARYLIRELLRDGPGAEAEARRWLMDEAAAWREWGDPR